MGRTCAAMMAREIVVRMKRRIRVVELEAGVSGGESGLGGGREWC
jgi:hypothetical protein